MPGSEKKQERTERELEFQRGEAARLAGIEATKESTVARYRRNTNWRVFPKEFIYREMGVLDGKSVLDYGCGTGEISTQLALLGATRVLGFDLSPDLLSLAAHRASLDGVEDRVELLVADGEDVALPRDSFDIVLVYALLHHTEIEPVMTRVMDALKPGGRAFILEPVAFSRVLSRIRDFVPVPKHVSPDERQLSAQEIDTVRSYFSSSQVGYFKALGRLQRLILRDGAKDSAPLRWAANLVVQYLDRVILMLPGAWRAAGTIVIVGVK